jgi:glycerol uptake facilitator-like aquaporin
MLGVAKKFVSHVLPAIVKPLRVLWNEMIGFVFLVFAVVGASSAYRNLSNANDPDSFGRGMVGALFGLIMLGFGVHSFLRARKIKRAP